MAHEQLNLTNDELLSTTRAVRKRLDFDRDVPMSVIKECMEIAVQAPTGSNAQGWQFMFVTDPDKRKQIGAYYQQAFSLYKEMPVAIHKLHADSDDQSLTSSQTRSASSADYLADHMGDAPVLMIPCIAGRTDNEAGMNILSQTATLGSIIRRLGTLCSRRERAGSVRPGQRFTSCLKKKLPSCLRSPTKM